MQHDDVEVEREVVHTTPTTEVAHVEPAYYRAPATVDRVHTAAYDPYAGRRRASEKLVQAVYLVFGLIETLIAIRFILRLLGANSEAGFAQFIYGITAPFIAPFVGLFGTVRASGSVLEPESIVAIIVYALAAWLLAKVLWLMLGETRSAVATSTTSVDTHVH